MEKVEILAVSNYTFLVLKYLINTSYGMMYMIWD